MEKHKGLFGSFGVQSLMCMCKHPSDAEGSVAGAVSGALLVWKARSLVAVLPAFEDCVTSLKCIPGVGLLGGSADCSVRFWLPDMTPGTLLAYCDDYVKFDLSV